MSDRTDDLAACAFRRVEAEQAGDDALGILVPPAKRTFVILRPRLLPLDLVLCAAEEPRFRDLSHDEASAAAQGLYRALREWSAGGDGSVEVREGTLRVAAGGFHLVACARAPGQPYSVLADATLALASRVRAYLCPPEGVEQPVYFNVRHFDRAGG